MIGKCLFAIILVCGLRADLDYLLRSLVFSHFSVNSELPNYLMTGYELIGAFLVATLFVLIYSFLIRRKTLVTGTAYGLVFGLVGACVFVFISPASKPPALTHAAIRLLADICQATLAGMLIALVLKPSRK